MNILFEHDYQQKIMSQTFAEPVTLATPADVQKWRAQWMGALSSWHSPYKVLLDCRNLTVATDDEVKNALEIMVRFFKGFFLKKVVGFGFDKEKGHEFLPFPVHADEEEALKDVGLRRSTRRDPTDFRSAIQLQNHFQQHVIELSFADPVTVDSKDQVATLKSKLMNNLMQWHSKWSLLVDCTNLEVGPGLEEDFNRLFQVMKGFFMKVVIGYSPKGPKDSYPFQVYRSRHRAAAVLEGEGNFSGDQADCRSRKAEPG